MNEIRSAYCATGAVAAHLLGRPEVTEHWNDESALQAFSVAGLSGHLLRALITVDECLDAPPPTTDPISAAQYFFLLGVTGDVNHPANQAVRQRGEEHGAKGPAAIAAQADDLVAKLATRLQSERDDRKMSVVGGLVLNLDDYLATRLIELTVHIDDLALSVGVDDEFGAALPGTDIAIATLVEVAQLRHGELGVLRALTRRERDAVDALRVL